MNERTTGNPYDNVRYLPFPPAYEYERTLFEAKHLVSELKFGEALEQYGIAIEQTNDDVIAQASVLRDRSEVFLQMGDADSALEDLLGVRSRLIAGLDDEGVQGLFDLVEAKIKDLVEAHSKPEQAETTSSHNSPA